VALCFAVGEFWSLSVARNVVSGEGFRRSDNMNIYIYDKTLTSTSTFYGSRNSKMLIRTLSDHPMQPEVINKEGGP